MRERSCIVVPCGNIIVARVAERVFGEPRWLMVEEYDVTKDVLALIQPATVATVEEATNENPATNGSD